MNPHGHVAGDGYAFHTLADWDKNPHEHPVSGHGAPGSSATGDRLVVVPPEEAASDVCRCKDARGPHIHCPWGGFHVHKLSEDEAAAIEEACRG